MFCGRRFWFSCRAAKLAATLILLAPLLRIATHFSGSEFLEHRIYYMLHTRMDALMFGCLAALLEGGTVLEAVYVRLRPAAFGFPLFVFVVSPQLEHRFGGAYTYLVGYSLVGFSIAMMMLYAIRESQTAIARLLNSRELVHLGVISYSLYLWQQLFLNPQNVSLFGRLPLNLVCIAACA
jgi:peptidoglycan/LPS O-acetylase OafA/YrhL